MIIPTPVRHLSSAATSEKKKVQSFSSSSVSEPLLCNGGEASDNSEVKYLSWMQGINKYIDAWQLHFPIFPWDKAQLLEDHWWVNTLGLAPEEGPSLPSFDEAMQFHYRSSSDPSPWTNSSCESLPGTIASNNTAPPQNECDASWREEEKPFRVMPSDEYGMALLLCWVVENSYNILTKHDRKTGETKAWLFYAQVTPTLFIVLVSGDYKLKINNLTKD